MAQVHIVKDGLCFAFGTLGALIAAAFGGWDAALTTLIIFMIADYITGLIVAGVFHKSDKTPDGTLESRAGWKGLIRKGLSLLVVLVACRLDMLMGTQFIKDTVVISLIVNETISLIENMGLIGIPFPSVIVSAIHVLKEQADRGAVSMEQMRKNDEPKEPPDGEGGAE